MSNAVLCLEFVDSVASNCTYVPRLADHTVLSDGVSGSAYGYRIAPKIGYVMCGTDIIVRMWISILTVVYFCSNILMACGGHTPSQARQNMQSGSFDMSGFFSEAKLPGVSNHSYTATGHASMQAPSATQMS